MIALASYTYSAAPTAFSDKAVRFTLVLKITPLPFQRCPRRLRTQSDARLYSLQDLQAERAFKSTFAAQNVRILQSMRSKNLARTKLRLASPVLVAMNQPELPSSSSVAVNEAEQQIFELSGRRTEKEWDRLLVSFSV